ncbi:MAG: hypothetical protein IKP49_09115 [Treponema sp.]|nr:hypothetical protein [Treponema sp.]
MKKLFKTIVAAVSVASLFFTGCSDVGESVDESKNAYIADSRLGEYADIGSSIYDALALEFGSAENARNAISSMSDNDDDVSSESLLESGLVNEKVSAYITRIDFAIDSSEEASAAISAITDIELDAMNALNGEDLTAVMSYAESSKATITYFDNAADDSFSRSAWSRFKKRVKRVMKKAAKAAAVCAVLGAISGITEGPIGMLTEAAYGAVLGATIGTIVGIADEVDDWRQK